VRETGAGRTEVHVLHHWCHLGTAKSDDERLFYLGNALENLRVAAHALGFEARLQPWFDEVPAAATLGVDPAEEGVPAELLEPFGFELRTLEDYAHAIEVEETGDTFAENAALKATQQARHLNAWVLGRNSKASS